MPLTLTTVDGATFTGLRPGDVVRQMRDANWQRGTPKGKYMDDVIDRVEQITGQPFLGRRRPITFIKYLETAGFVTVRYTELN